MALIKCPDCGKQISDKASECPNCGCPSSQFAPKICPECGNVLANGDITCPNCGFPLDSTFQINKTQNRHTNINPVVVIHGYEEWFAVKSNISIYRDNEYLGEVGPAGRFSIEIERDCCLRFKCAFRSTTLNVRRGIDTDVYLSFNRFTGGLNARTTR